MSDIARDLRHLDKSLPAPTLRTSEVMESWLNDITECHQAAADEIDRLRAALEEIRVITAATDPVVRALGWGTVHEITAKVLGPQSPQDGKP